MHCSRHKNSLQRNMSSVILWCGSWNVVGPQHFFNIWSYATYTCILLEPIHPSFLSSCLPTYLPLQPTRVRACQCERGSWVTLAMRCVALRRVVWCGSWCPLMYSYARVRILVQALTPPTRPFDPDTRTLRCVCLVNDIAYHYAGRVLDTVSVVNIVSVFYLQPMQYIHMVLCSSTTTINNNNN